MDLDVKSLPDDPAKLKEIISTLLWQYQDMEARVRLLQNEIFGRKSEKAPREDRAQIPLFGAGDGAAPTPVEPPPEVVPVAGHNRRKRVRKPLPADLPRVEVIHDLDEAEKRCPCGSDLKRIGEAVCEKLDYVPARVQVERHIRYKYACPACEGVEDEGPTVKIAPAPPQLIPKSFATAGLVAHIACAKFEDALPLYRQEKIFARKGIELPRSTLCSWLIKAAERAGPVMALLGREVRSGPVVNADETPLQVMKEPGRADTAKSYMWVFRGGDPKRPAVVFRYHATRSGQVPLDFLKGYRGYVQCDGYAGYEALGREPGVTLVGCWAHARRKFDKIAKAMGGKKKHTAAAEALDFIAKLYAIEKQARKERLDADQLRHRRQQEAKPVVDAFKTWLEAKAPLTPPAGLLGKAIGYTLDNWPRLVLYLNDGRLRPDNNLAENAIRPFVVGRKNWLFAGNPDGAHSAAAYYSLVETAKANGLKPYRYLCYLFDRLPLAQSDNDYQALLPQKLTPEIIATPKN